MTRFTQHHKAVLAIVAAVAVLGGTGLIGANSWSPGDGCGYRVQPGDTLNEIADAHNVPAEDIALNTPQIVDMDKIGAGWLIDVCHHFESAMNRGLSAGQAPAIANNPRSLSNRAASARIPGIATEWGTVLAATKPAWADADDIRFGVFIAGPESNYDLYVTNPGDANPPTWGASTGLVQIRPFLKSSDIRNEPWRDPAQLAHHDRSIAINAQAEAFWAILRTQGRKAWGPTTNGIAPGGGCSGSSRPSQCAEWSNIAEAVMSYLHESGQA